MSNVEASGDVSIIFAHKIEFSQLQEQWQSLGHVFSQDIQSLASRLQGETVSSFPGSPSARILYQFKVCYVLNRVQLIAGFIFRDTSNIVDVLTKAKVELSRHDKLINILHLI